MIQIPNSTSKSDHSGKDQQEENIIFQAKACGDQIGVNIVSKSLSQLLTALKLTEIQIERLILSTQAKQQKDNIVQVPKAIIDKMRGL